MNCTKCGAPMQADQVFCPACGQPVQVLPGTAPEAGKAKKTLFWAPGGGAPGMMPPGPPASPATPPAQPPATGAAFAPQPANTPAAPPPAPPASQPANAKSAASHAPTMIATPGMLPNFSPPGAAFAPMQPPVPAPAPMQPPMPAPAPMQPPVPAPAPMQPPMPAPAPMQPPMPAPAPMQPPMPAPAPAATGTAGIPALFLESFQLLPGETLQYFIEGDGFFLGTNLFLKIMARIQAFFTLISGGHIRIGFLLTSQRLLILQSAQVLCGAKSTKTVQTIALSSIAEAAAGLERQCMCINTRVIHVQSRTFRHSFVAKKFDDLQMQEFITRMSELIRHNAG